MRRTPGLMATSRALLPSALIALAGCHSAAAASSPPATPAAPAAASTDGTTPAALRTRVLDTMRVVLDRAARDSAFPAAYAVVGTRSGIIAEYGVGHLDWGSTPGPDANTRWDLASLSKVVGMTSAMIQLVGEGKVDLDAPVQRYLPRWTGQNKEKVTVRHLLTHSSGMPAWRPLYKEATTPAEALALVYSAPLDTLPGVRMVYSDLGAILLGQIVETVSGEKLDRYLANHVYGPLKMTSTGFLPAASERERIAPTEFDPWRQRKLRGEVHDENAFALGGVSAHAGLFSSAHDLARFARMYLNGGTLDGVRVFKADVVTRFTTVQDTTISRRALGWETPTGGNSAGHKMTAHAFGHTGFTGTSIWMDPGQDVFVVLLTNRVNPTRQNTKIGGVRVALADAVVTTLGVARGTAGSAPSSSPSRIPRP